MKGPNKEFIKAFAKHVKYPGSAEDFLKYYKAGVKRILDNMKPDDGLCPQIVKPAPANKNRKRK
jgi:hypothetical protein